MRGIAMDLAYLWYEAAHLMMTPARAATDATRLAFSNPVNPLAHTPYGRSVAAACELFERTTRRYGKPAFGIETAPVGPERVPVREQVVWERPFCQLLHFEKVLRAPRDEPRLLIVAPMSGHYATL